MRRDGVSSDEREKLRIKEKRFGPHTFDESQGPAAHALLEENDNVVLLGNGTDGWRHAHGLGRHIGRYIEAELGRSGGKRKAGRDVGQGNEGMSRGRR